MFWIHDYQEYYRVHCIDHLYLTSIPSLALSLYEELYQICDLLYLIYSFYYKMLFFILCILYSHMVIEVQAILAETFIIVFIVADLV